MSRKVPMFIIAVGVIVTAISVTAILRAQPRPVRPLRGTTVELDRLHRVYDPEFGVACYYSPWGESQVPSCLRVR